MKDFRSIRFNLTSDMANDIIAIYKLKEELEKLKKERKGDLTLNDKYNHLEKELNDYKKKFIHQFKESNKEQIIEFQSLKKDNKN